MPVIGPTPASTLMESARKLYKVFVSESQQFGSGQGKHLSRDTSLVGRETDRAEMNRL